MRLKLCAALVFALGIAACGGGQENPPPKAASTGDAFDSQVKCSAIRPSTEPDLMGWDPGSRANLATLRTQGVVAVRYRAEGCNVELEVLSNCIGKGKYTYAPYAAMDTKIAHNQQELFAELPIGAGRLGGKLKSGRALRTDYTLVGMQSLPAGSSYVAADLRGPDCGRATHVVSRMYVGGFAMVAGESRAIEASASVFGAGAGGGDNQGAEHIAREGVAEACATAQAEGRESTRCAVPLRVGLLAIEGRGQTDPKPSDPSPKSAPPEAPTSTPPSAVIPFDRAAAAKALSSVKAQDCKKAGDPSGAGHVWIMFVPDGSVSHATVDSGPFVNTPVGDCIANKFREARVPRFTGAGIKVGTTFVVN